MAVVAPVVAAAAVPDGVGEMRVAATSVALVEAPAPCASRWAAEVNCVEPCRELVTTE